MQSWFSVEVPTEKKERLAPVLAYIQENLSNKLSLEELATVINMSVPHFCRMFKLVAHQTPVQYINNQRIIRAAGLLSETDRTVLEISEDCGFFSISNFINTFKKHTRKSPLEFRKSRHNLDRK